MFLHIEHFCCAICQGYECDNESINFYTSGKKFNIVFSLMKKWINLIIDSLNLDKACCLHILYKHNFTNKLIFEYENKYLLRSNEVKLVGIKTR